jgi:hypothetical protein
VTESTVDDVKPHIASSSHVMVYDEVLYSM